LTPVTVRPESGAIGRTLRDIDLHTHAGAIVVAIGRGGADVIVPTGEEVLCEGDVLELAGSSDAVSTAIGLLNTSRNAGAELTASE
jgi:uncharacterized protein with PhoU and TrkA domain